MKKKLFYAVWLVVAMFICCPAALLADNTSSSKMEGDGYDTPEEAILAFADALKEGDLDQIISTFAIETYCDNYDTALAMQRTGTVLAETLWKNGNIVAPSENDFYTDLNVNSRRGKIAEQLKSNIAMISLDNIVHSDDEILRNVGEALLNGTIYHEDDQGLPASKLTELVEAFNDIPDFSDMDVSEPISFLMFSALNDNYISEQSFTNMFRQTLPNGADGMTELGLILENDDSLYLITMNIVKYGDKWYNCSLGGFISMALGIDMNRQGIVGGPKEYLPDILGYNAEQIKELQAAGKALAVEKGQELKDLKTEYEERHQQLLSDGESHYGVTFNIDDSWQQQIDKLKEADDDSGRSFMNDVAIMSYDEMLEYFSLEELMQ